MTSEEIRERFLRFFQKKGHLIKPGSSLIPREDPTLLFTSAGMVPFKPFFLGKAKPEASRIATSQMCFRTTDIEKVGKVSRYLTFFEMLGNFSFGDYFKEEAISYAWELVTEELKLDPQKLWITVFEKDDEARKIWMEEIGIKSERIKSLPEKENFWAAGPVGPCGPDTEIFIDLGKKYGCGQKTCSPGCNCDRYLELWNLVFMQFNRDEKGKLTPLPRKNIDTGLGLERVSAVMQGVGDAFETDLFKPLMDSLRNLGKIKPARGKAKDEQSNENISLKIIADHLRAVVFLTNDGLLPSNEGRGYVLRRILRRAIRHGKNLGLNKPFLYKSGDVVIDTMKEAYPQLVKKRGDISKVILNEEERFHQTLEKGLEILNNLIEELKEKKRRKISGKEAFKLYDTYGFPFDLTREIVAEEGFRVGEKEFEDEMQAQRLRARKASGFEEKVDKIKREKWSKKERKTKFSGYEKDKCETSVLGIVEGDREVKIILQETPFYAEAGGQVGDSGVITNEKVEIEIEDTQRKGEVIEHVGRYKKGKFEDLEPGDRVVASLDLERRQAIARNHTGTHLLQSALRKVLGTHVEQRGSLVAADRLRFDFTHFQGLSEEELSRVEYIVNSLVWHNLMLKASDTTLSKARQMGALAIFGEKYQEKVRLVRIAGASLELCGGTHLKSTGEMGIFKLLNETAVSSGIRRIEGLTGEAAYDFLKSGEEEIKKIAKKLKVQPSEVGRKVTKLVETLKDLEREVSVLKKKGAVSQVETLLNQAREVQGTRIISAGIKNADLDVLRSLGDSLKEKMGSGIIVLGAPEGKKVVLITLVSENLVKEGLHAGKIINEVAKIVEGGGGGRADFAQAGGKKPSRLKEALEKAPEIAKKQLEKIKGKD